MKKILEALSGSSQVFGHRGAKAYAPMNTIPAFLLAREQGATGIELDVHLTQDAHPIILHDYAIDATSNAQGLAKDMTLEQLKALDFGGWFGEAYAGTQIPTLEEVFEALGKSMWINVELKSETATTDGLEQIVADCIQRFDLIDHVIVSSFNPFALKRFRQILPQVALGYLFDEHTQTLTRPLMEGFQVEALHPHETLIDEAMMQTARNAGQLVNTWTVNSASRAQQLSALGVGAIITDQPDLIFAALQD